MSWKHASTGCTEGVRASKGPTYVHARVIVAPTSRDCCATITQSTITTIKMRQLSGVDCRSYGTHSRCTTACWCHRSIPDPREISPPPPLSPCSISRVLSSTFYVRYFYVACFGVLRTTTYLLSLARRGRATSVTFLAGIAV
jgi:hypothetical protein